MKSKIRSALFIFGVAVSAIGAPHTESDYAEIVVAFEQKDYDRSHELIENLLKDDPEDIKALELKALTLKTEGSPKQALDVFLRLRDLSTKKRLAAERSAPYDFQAGLLLLEMNRYKEARPLLSSAVRADFNTAAAKYFLGLIALSEHLDSEAQSHFRYVVRSKPPLLRASAYYYLGVIAKRRDDSKQAIWDWKEARTIASNLLATPDISDDTAEAAKRLDNRAALALKAGPDEEGKPGSFAHVALITSYDSNVLLNPLIDVGATNTPTLMQTARYGIGHAFRFGDQQLTPTFRGSFNYNFNPDAAGGQFLINDLGLSHLVHPYSAFQFGFRTGLTYIMRNDANGVGNNVLTSQSLGIPVAVFLRQIWPRLQWTTEFAVTPQQFYTDAFVAPNLKKTGFDWRARTQLQFSSVSRLFNPSFEADVYVLQTNGPEYRSYGADVAILNQFYFTKSTTATLRGAVGYSEFVQRPDGERYDTELSAALVIDYRWWKSLHLLIETAYYDNISNISDIYRYRRFVAGVGVDYRY